jgi:hypothetical protein
MLRCRLLGHRFRFTTEEETMRWHCDRGCGAGGAKRYPDADQAALYARGLDRQDRDDVGRRSPIGLLPLRLLRAARRHRTDT